MNTVAIIQARMSSTRLPGKILMDIEGKSMLWHVINRVRASKLIDKIVVATTLEKQDDVTEEFCKKYDLDFYRGSEADVLDRYYQAAKAYQARVVVRITADCPLIDPQEIDKVIASYLKNQTNFDGACNVIKRTYPRGLDTEVVSFGVLEKCWQESDQDYQREHVTPYIKEHPELFRLYSVENNFDFSHLRWTVDEEDDLKLIREIYRRLYKNNGIFLMKDILEVFEKESWLIEINKCVKQK